MKVGFVNLIGRPNAGKSTLLNNIIDYDLSIISSKPQTTRNIINGIYQDDDSQIIFVDTPGIHKPKSEFGDFLNSKAYQTFNDTDLIVFLQPANEAILKGDFFILEKLKDLKKPKIALLTKLDLVRDPEAIAHKIKILGDFNFKLILSTTIYEKSSINLLVKEIKAILPDGEKYYPDDQITNSSISFLAKEVIRLSAIENLEEEVPHSILVRINNFSENEEHNNIDATIFVERDSQKGIVIGKNGVKIGKIRKMATSLITKKLDKKCKLHLQVKVLPKWTKNKSKFQTYN